MIQAGTSSQTQTMPIVRLSQNDRLRLIIAVPESAVSRIQLKTPVDRHVSSAVDQTFPGTVARFADRLDADTRTMRVEVDVTESAGELVPGMYAAGVDRARPGARRADRAGRRRSIATVTAAVRGRRHRRTTLVEPRTVDGRPRVGRSRVEVARGRRRRRPRRRRQSRAVQAGMAVSPKVVAPSAGGGRTLMSRFSIRNPYFIVVVCLIVTVIGLTSLVRMPVDLFPDDQHPAGRRRDVLQRHAARTDRDRHHRTIRALLHARRRHRSHGVAIAAGHQHHQGVLPARHRRRLRRQRDLEPGDGRSAAPAAGHAAADRPEVRRVEPAGVSDHAARARD